MKKVISTIYWTLYNHLYVLFASSKATGVLPDKKDLRDHLWVQSSGYKKIHLLQDVATNYDVKDWRFDQYPFNICVFASSMMGASWQEGIRFSVRWMVKLARKNRMITGNGFSYLRAPKKLAYHFGMLPYEEMPDEIGSMSWEEYSRWTPEDEELLEVAKHYKISEYTRLTKTEQAYKALDCGYTLHTASKWYSSMMMPKAPRFLLQPAGRKLGGHAYADTGYNDNLFIVTNSFGTDWGDEGQAHDAGLFELHDYGVYVQELLEMKQKLHYYFKYHNNKCVKGTSGTIYLIEDCGKRPFKKWGDYLVWCGKQGISSNSYSLVRDDVLKSIPTIS